MVASLIRGPFHSHGAPVRLLVSFLAWVDLAAYRFCPPGTPTSRFLAPDEPLVFAGYRLDVPGGCLVRDGAGVLYRCPLDYLADPVPRS